MKRLFLTFFATMLGLVAMADDSDYSKICDFEVDGIYYQFVDDDETNSSVLVSRNVSSPYSSYSGNVVIPSTVTYESKEYTVTLVGADAFKAEDGSSTLTSVVLPSTITKIENGAFDACGALTSLTVDTPFPPLLAGDVFTRFSTTGVLHVPANTLYEGWAAQMGEGWTVDYTTSNSVLLYQNTSGTAYPIKTLWSDGINYESFDCTLEEYRYENGWGMILFDGELTSIDEEAFKDFTDLTAIVIPEGVTNIGYGVFWGCSALASVTFPESLNNIGYCAFADCTSLQSITLPKNVRRVIQRAFSGCSSLSSITCEGMAPPTLGANALSGVSPTGVMKVVGIEGGIPGGPYADWKNALPEGWTFEYDGDQSQASYLHFTTTDHEPIELNSKASERPIVAVLYDQYEGATIMFAGQLTEIRKDVFTGISTLATIDIPEGVVTICDSAFQSCTGLVDVKLPNTLQTIGNYAFQYCSHLPAITLNANLANVGTYAFDGCSALASITHEGMRNPTFSSQPFGPYGNQTISPYGVFTLPDNYSGIQVWMSLLPVGWSYYDFVLLYTSTMNDYVTVDEEAFTPRVFPDGNHYRNGVGYLQFGSPLKEIGDYAFKNAYYLSSVKLPRTVTSISQGAFHNCWALSSITLNEGLTTIWDDAFKHCYQLSSLEIPSTVDHIWYGLFDGCYSLTSLTVNPNNPIFDSRDNCNAIIRTADNALVAGCSFTTCVPAGVTTIDDYAFKGITKLGTLEFVGDVTTIKQYAFVESELASIELPASLRHIDPTAFAECKSLTSLSVADGNAKFDSRGNTNAVYETATNTLVVGCCNTQPIPEGVTAIGDSAFYYCKDLTSLDIPKTVTFIGAEAFYDCIELNEITVRSTIAPSFGPQAFYHLPSGGTLTVPLGCEANYSKWMKELRSWNIVGATVPEGNNVIVYTADSKVMPFDENAFSAVFIDDVYDESTGVGYILFASELAEIKADAFKDCTGFLTVSLPSTVTAIGDNAFQGCTKLTSINIPAGVTTIGDHAFDGCAPLASITLPEGLETIGEFAFRGCKVIETLFIPKTVAAIGTAAFTGCTALTSIVVDADNTAYDCREQCNAIIQTEGDVLIAGCTSAFIPTSVKAIADYAFFGCQFPAIDIPDGVTTIGISAFEQCDKLTSVIIPASTKYVQERGFALCTSLQTATFPYFFLGIYNEGFLGDKLLSQMTSLAPYAPTLGRDVFKGLPSTGLLIIPSDVPGTGNLYATWVGRGEPLDGWTLNTYVVLTLRQTGLTEQTITLPLGSSYVYVDHTVEGNALADIKFNGVSVIGKMLNGKYMTPALTENATLEITYSAEIGGLFGDLTNDGNVDVSDVTKLVDIILHRESAGETH